jgi:heme oxygenase
MSGTRRWQLREATAAAHAAVDETVGSFATLDGYKSYLAASLQFREPIERALARTDWPAAFGAWRPASVSAAIRADMADLGLASPTEGTIDPPAGVARLLGTLYVLEGSILGARVLLQRAQGLGLSDTHGARHLALLSRDLDGWRTFLGLLETAEPFDLDHATAASLSTFAAAEVAYRRVIHD